MRAVLQRVASARVTVEAREVGAIGHGLLVFLGVEHADGPDDIDYTVRKIRDARIFEEVTHDGRSRMNRSVADCGGSVLVVSQFTLAGDLRRGRRPSFDAAAPAEVARAGYEAVVDGLRAAGLPVATGEFQAMMQVALVNDGPVTILVDSRRRF